MKRKSALLDNPHRSPKRRKSSPFPTPPASTTATSRSLSHSLEDIPPDLAGEALLPVSRPEIVLDTYDPEFGAKVCAAWASSVPWNIKQQKMAWAYSWREHKYGEEVAASYPPGMTPESSKKVYQKAQEEAERALRDETTSDEDEPAQSSKYSDHGKAPGRRRRLRRQCADSNAEVEPFLPSLEVSISRKRRRHSLACSFRNSNREIVHVRASMARRRSAPPDCEQIQEQRSVLER